MPDTSPTTDSASAMSMGPFLDLLGAEQVAASEGHATWRLAVRECHLRTLGILHGGVVAVLLDTALGRAVSTVCPANLTAVTAQLNVNFVRPARAGEVLLASGEVQHFGRRTAVARGELRTDSDILVATASGTFFFVPTPEPGAALLELPRADA